MKLAVINNLYDILDVAKSISRTEKCVVLSLLLGLVQFSSCLIIHLSMKVECIVHKIKETC